MKTDGNLTINITTGTILKAVLVLLGVYLIYVMQDLVLILLTAVVIASSVEPATKWFARYKIPRLPAVLIVYIIGATMLFGIFYFFVPPLVTETTNFISQAPKYLESLDLGTTVGNIGGIQAQNFSQEITTSSQFREVLQNLRDAASQLSGGVFQTISTIFGGLVSFVLIIVFSFYLSVQERGIDTFLRVITPSAHEAYVMNLWQRAQSKIGKWMQGQMVLVIIIGVLTFLGLTILDMRHAFLLAVFAGLAELIPLFGPILAAIPAIALGFVDGGLTLALLVAGLFLILQQFENHLIYPLVVRKVVGVPALLVIIALIVGGQLAGFLGILLSVPVAAVLQELAADIQKGKAKSREETQTA